MFIIRNFLKFSYQSGTSMPDHVSNFKRLKNELAELKINLPEEVESSILISSLPETYEIEKRTWEQMGDSITLTDLYGKINNLENNETSHENLALSQTKLYCTHCKTSTHDTQKCYKLKNKNGSKKFQKSKKHAQKRKDTNYSLMAKSQTSTNNLQWILDSGATMHLTGNRDLLSDLESIPNKPVVSANGGILQATHIGKAKLEQDDRYININDVYYVPGMTHNLLSISTIAQKYGVQFRNNLCTITTNEGTKLLQSQQNAGLYTVPAFVFSAIERSKPIIPLLDAHQRLGHVHFQKIKQMAANDQLPFHILEEDDPEIYCETCFATKTTRSPIPKLSTSNITKIGELIHTDIWGPISIKSTKNIHHQYEDYRYFITFIDEYTGYTTLFPMKNKSDAFQMFQTYCSLFFTLHGKRSIKTLRSDNGTEYTSKHFKAFCLKNGIRQQFTAPYSSFQNGVAERKNRTIIEGTRALLYESDLDQSLWTYAAIFTNKLQNCVYDTKRKCMPHEKFFKESNHSLLSTTLTWGQPVWTYLHPHQRNKLEPTAKKGFYLGPDPSRKSILVLVDNKVITSRDYRISPFTSTTIEREQSINPPIAHFSESDTSDEDEIVIKPKTSNEDQQQVIIDQDPIQIPPNTSPVIQKLYHVINDERRRKQEKKSKAKTRGTYEIQDIDEPAPRAISAPPTNPSRRANSKASSNLRAAAYSAIVLKQSTAINEPCWYEAMKKEIESQLENQSWILVPRTPEMHVLPCRWVFALKKNPDGSNKYKARLVVGGHRQKEGIDFKETFAPVLKYTSLRILLAIATFYDYEVHQIDFVTAFLNANLDETIYMEQPYGFSGDTDDVCKLEKGVYGLKQSPRQWSKKVTEILSNLGFKNLDDADESIYITTNWNNTNTFIIIAVYVDDCALMSNSKESLNELEELISKDYKVKRLGELNTILNMTWTRDRDNRTSTLTQTAYIENILKEFKMEDSKSVSTPAIPETQEESKLLPCNKEYMKAIGSLIYLTTCTRPDIAYAVSKVAEKMQSPTAKDWTAVKRIFRYLKETKNQGLTFRNQGNSSELNLQVYSDADWASDPSRKSRSGNVIFLANGAISWYSKKQNCVSLSTVEAEYVSGSKAIQDLIWIKKLLHLLNFNLSNTNVYLDNQGAIAVTKNPVHHARTKHIDLRLHFMREHYLKKEFNLYYCKTTDMIADILTKALNKQLHEKHASTILDYTNYMNTSQEGVLLMMIKDESNLGSLNLKHIHADQHA
jgi:hypothetical protein